LFIFNDKSFSVSQMYQFIFEYALVTPIFFFGQDIDCPKRE